MNSLTNLLEEASSFVKSEFGFGIEQSVLQRYGKERWVSFCTKNGFESSAEGIYIPRTKKAYVRTDSPAIISNTFHELYGHGLFCEQSMIGEELEKIITEGESEEEYFFAERTKDEKEFGFANKNIHDYEGFALWLESTMCEELGVLESWSFKKRRLPRTHRSLHEYFQGAERQLTRLGLMAQMGFPKHYTREQLANTIKRISTRSTEEFELIVAYGSKKPRSDIDIFAIHQDTSTQCANAWLDWYQISRGEAEEKIRLLDLSVTDPIMKGTIIKGDENYLERMRKELCEQPITQEMINHNLRGSQEQAIIARQCPEGTTQQITAQDYARTYKKNAEQLSKGHKPLTLEGLERVYGPLRTR